MRSSRPQSASVSPAPSLGNLGQKVHSAQTVLDFDAYVAPGRFNDDALIRATITASIRKCPKSREVIAEEMSVALDVRVTAKMLNTYSADAMQLNRLPAAWLRAFCLAVGSDALMRCVAETAGYRLIRDEEIQLLEFGRQFLLSKRATEKAQELERQLAEVQL